MTESDDEEAEWARNSAANETRRLEILERYKAFRADGKRFYEIFGAEHGFYWLTEAELAEFLARPTTSAYEEAKFHCFYKDSIRVPKDRTVDGIDKLLASGAELRIDDQWWPSTR